MDRLDITVNCKYTYAIPDEITVNEVFPINNEVQVFLRNTEIKVENAAYPMLKMLPMNSQMVKQH